MIYTWKIPCFQNCSNAKAFQSFTDTCSLKILLQILLPLTYPQHEWTDQGKPYQRQYTKMATDSITELQIHITNYKREAIPRREKSYQDHLLFFFVTCNAWTTPEANYRENSVVIFLVFHLLIVEQRTSVKKYDQIKLKKVASHPRRPRGF